MSTKEYTDNRAPAAPPDVPSVYESDDQVVLHWEEDGQTPTIRKMTAESARIMAEELFDSAGKIDPARVSRPFSLEEHLGLDVDSVGGGISLCPNRRLGSATLGHDDIDTMIAELRAAKRQSLEIRGDPVPAGT